MASAKGATYLTPGDMRRLRRIIMIARVMDTAIRVPGLGIRIGMDSVLGLVPGVGDLAGAAIGLAIINEGRRLGLPHAQLARMLVNLGIDAAFGTVPVVGDVFDVYFKSHRRNAAIVLEHLGITDDDLLDAPMPPPSRRR
jgi:hypothetical protein